MRDVPPHDEKSRIPASRHLKMEFAYRVDGWQALFTALAGASASLVGLLFIALSLNLRTIVKTPSHKARARETLGGMFTLLLLSVLMLIPGQTRLLLGIELMVGGIILLIIGTRLQLQTLSRLPSHQHRVNWVLRLLLLDSGTLAGTIAGFSLIIGRFGGLFWLVPMIIIYLLWTLNNAWILMVQAGDLL